MSDDDPGFDAVVAGLRRGEPAVVRAFCDQYGGALERVAQGQMASALRQRVGADDVVQSVYRTFFRRAGDGQFTLDEAADLWRLLAAITVTKVREKARFHLRQRRGIDREVVIDDGPGGGGVPMPQALVASPEELAAVSLAFEEILSRLDDEERRIVDLKLQDASNFEIAQAMGCSERTVRRLLGRMKGRFSRVLDG